MTPLAFVLILASAAFHATWNMVAKKEGASLAFYAFLITVGALCSSGVRFVSPLHFSTQPPAFYAWLAGMIAAELLYATGLRLAYRALDMSTAYPLMRSIPLVLLAVITAAFGFGKPLGAKALAGLALVFAGCLVIPLRTFSDFRLSHYIDRNFGHVLLVALGTTGYTLCDSQAQRVMMAAAPEVSRTMVALSYYAFRAVPLVTVLWTVVFCGRETRAEAADLWRRRSWTPVFAGCCSTLTYTLVLVAMNVVTNVSYVQAFRQIGLVFGLLEGVFILKERCTPPKVAGVALILVGLAVSVA